MPSKRTSNDVGLVESTQYNVQTKSHRKGTPPKPWPLPNFNPFHIDDFDDYGKPNLPPGIEQNNPFAIFS
jgi:hypothetical protein